MEQLLMGSSLSSVLVRYFSHFTCYICDPKHWFKQNIHQGILWISSPSLFKNAVQRLCSSVLANHLVSIEENLSLGCYFIYFKLSYF